VSRAWDAYLVIVYRVTCRITGWARRISRTIAGSSVVVDGAPQREYAGGGPFTKEVEGMIYHARRYATAATSSCRFQREEESLWS
jgi:hypothetical protein